MKHYYAIFKKTSDIVEVEFPDLPGCVTFGRDWEGALRNAEDVLAAWLTHAERKFVKKPSTHYGARRIKEKDFLSFLDRNSDEWARFHNFNLKVSLIVGLVILVFIFLC